MKHLLALLALSISMQTLRAQEELPVFDAEYWAPVRLAQVHFLDNPKKDKAFMLDKPQGWVRVSDLTEMLNAEVMAKATTEQKLAKYQAVYPYVILAKVLDAWSWNKAPYQYQVPQELTDYALEFLFEQYALHRELDRKSKNNEQLYAELFEEIQTQSDLGFNLDIAWPWCETESMKQVCSRLRLRMSKVALPEITLIFDKIPETLTAFKVDLSNKVQEWYAATRRRAAFDEIVELAKAKPLKKNETLQSKFYEILSSKIGVSVYSDYCAFPSLICNTVDLSKYNLNLNGQTLSIILGTKLQDKD